MTTEPVDPLVQLEADEAADARAAAEPVAAEPEGQAAEAAPAPAEPVQHPWAERFKSEDELWRGYQNLEAKFRERDDELGQLRQFQQQAAPVLQQFAQQQQHQPQYGQQQQDTLPDGTVLIEPAALEQAVEDGRISELQASMIWADQQAKVHAFAAAGQFRDELEPLRAAHIDRGARDILETVRQELGDDTVAANAELVARLLREDRAHYADPKHGGRRLKEAIVTAAWERERQGGTPKAQNEPIRDVHVEGGSGAQPQSAGGTRLSPEEQEIVDSLTWSRPVDEQGIPLPQ